MASIIASLPPLLFVQGRKTLVGTPSKLLVSSLTERQNRVSVAVKATGENSESSTSLNITESVQNVWDKAEDRPALIGLGFAAIVALWASANLVSSIDRLPVIPSILEIIGVLFSSWFVYRYLLFKPDREELFKIINKTLSDILGQ
ncbi:hypothetical protein UlMin_018161 [Ulmus minor]